jgi:hypothetical protein
MRKITLFLAFLLSVGTGFSQEGRTFRFGLKAAPNVSWMKADADNIETGNARLKFSYGLMTEFFISDNYIFSTGIEVLGAGGNLEYDPAAFYNTPTAATFRLKRRELNLQYINLPLILKMRTNEIGYMRYFGQFGFDTGFNTRARANDYGFLGADDASITNRDVSSNTQFFRIGLNLGLGFEYNLIGNTNLMVGIVYSNAFTNALRRKQDEVYSNQLDPQSFLLHRASANFVALNVGIFF